MTISQELDIKRTIKYIVLLKRLQWFGHVVRHPPPSSIHKVIMAISAAEDEEDSLGRHSAVTFKKTPKD